MEKVCTKYINRYGQIVRSNGKEKRDLIRCIEWNTDIQRKFRYSRNNSFRRK